MSESRSEGELPGQSIPLKKEHLKELADIGQRMDKIGTDFITRLMEILDTYGVVIDLREALLAVKMEICKREVDDGNTTAQGHMVTLRDGDKTSQAYKTSYQYLWRRGGGLSAEYVKSEIARLKQQQLVISISNSSSLSPSNGDNSTTLSGENSVDCVASDILQSSRDNSTTKTSASSAPIIQKSSSDSGGAEWNETEDCDEYGFRKEEAMAPGFQYNQDGDVSFVEEKKNGNFFVYLRYNGPQTIEMKAGKGTQSHKCHLNQPMREHGAPELYEVIYCKNEKVCMNYQL